MVSQIQSKSRRIETARVRPRPPTVKGKEFTHTKSGYALVCDTLRMSMCASGNGIAYGRHRSYTMSYFRTHISIFVIMKAVKLKKYVSLVFV